MTQKYISKGYSELIVYAPGVHKGGGLALLTQLIVGLVKSQQKFLVICDARAFAVLAAECSDEFLIKIRSDYFGKLFGELLLARQSGSNRLILCFHSKPPLVPLKSDCLIFFHNINVLAQSKDLKHFLQWAQIRFCLRKGYTVIVQSNFVLSAFQKSVPTHSTKLLVMPFFNFVDVENIGKKSTENSIEFDFIYPADYAFHKNHDRLLRAWILLASRGFYPTLVVTIRECECPKEIVDALKAAGSKVIFSGYLNRDELFRLYSKSAAMIFPSLAESFCLPLLEFAHFRRPILAANLCYSKEFVDCTDYFDPSSVGSIAASVVTQLKSLSLQRRLLIDAPSFKKAKSRKFNIYKKKIFTPDEFVNYLISYGL